MTVVVLGGGITGLAGAYALGTAGIPTLLLEGSPRLGGKVRTETLDGFVIEHGPDSFVGYRPAAVRLAGELGLGDAIVRPREPRTVFIRANGRLVRFPDGMGLVLPTKLRPFLASELFSPLEKLRMGLDLLLPRESSRADVGVGPFLRRRLGGALVDRLAGPLIGGVYGTAIDDLSLDAVVPQLRESERRHRSLLLAAYADARARARAAKAARAAGDPRPAPPSPFLALTGGTQQLIDALVEAIRAMPSVEIRQEAVAESLAPGVRGVTIGLRGGERIHAEAAILATPAPVTAILVQAAAPEAARHLRDIRHGTTAVVNLAYDARQLPDGLAGHGFLVADGEPLTISACTLSSNKWAGRAPDGALLVRAFVGASRPAGHALADDALVAAAHADVAGILGLRGHPTLTRVARYPTAMPHYTVGHLDRVAAVEAALRPWPVLRIAGGAYRGVGLPDCIGQGLAAAVAVVDLLSGTAAGPGNSAARRPRLEPAIASPVSAAPAPPVVSTSSSP